jgi:hypothetical protein
MTATTNIQILDYQLLEKEWFSLTTQQQKSEFWERMNIVFATSTNADIAIFFDKLKLDVKASNERLELAKQRAILAGFVPK